MLSTAHVQARRALSQTTRSRFRSSKSYKPITDNVILRITKLNNLQPCFSYMTRNFSSGFSSFQEPSPSLFSADTKKSNESDKEIDQDHNLHLRKDIRMMGSLLGKVIREHESSEIFNKIEEMRSMAKEFRALGAGRINETKKESEVAFQNLAEYVAKLSNDEIFTITRSFTHFLALANTAEAHHRARQLKELDLNTDKNASALHAKHDSCGIVFQKLLDEGHSSEKLFDALCNQYAELVLTAHPTQVNRRTILEKKRKIETILTMADMFRKAGATEFEMKELDTAMFRKISTIWLSDEVSRQKPTPTMEAEAGTLVIESVLWETVPIFLRKLDATAFEFFGKHLPLSAAPIKFASWMGGDRDGNPNVKPNTTREVILKNRQRAATLLIADMTKLWSELSITRCTNEFREDVGEEAREPYRVKLRKMILKMERTLNWINVELEYLHNPTTHKSPTSSLDEDIYIRKEELMNELLQIHDSLMRMGNEEVADGYLTDIIRNLSAFGLTLVPLDIRQESDRHEEAIDSITRYLGLGSYSQWDEDTRINWLSNQILSKRPLIKSGVWNEQPELFSANAVDTLETFKMIAEQPPDSLGAYVISQATHASDVLAVVLLQLDAGKKDPLRVAPLFETLDDLNGAEKTMSTLFSLPVYMGLINGQQEVMIGYSDSAKDAGRLAASWAQFKTQRTLSEVAKKFNIDMTFFHGKGGTVGRGGNPQTFHAITSHPPDTIKGKFRVTEQGEMIFQNFGYMDRAERTMDIYTAAILTEQVTPRQAPSEEYKGMMEKLSASSCDAYRQIVRHDERFVPYFRSATPELELASLNIGSRPAKRKATGGVESLRAIPWIFAWTQTRFNLPTWLGVGEALNSSMRESEESNELLHKMYKDWDFFRTMIDLVEMILTKSEPGIAKHYDDMLVSDPKAKDLGLVVRKKHLDTEQAILNLTQHTTLGENNKLLITALQVRNPYVDCLNVLQAEVLKRCREYEDGQEPKKLKDTLMTTISGVAAGMGNTG